MALAGLSGNRGTRCYLPVIEGSNPLVTTNLPKKSSCSQRLYENRNLDAIAARWNAKAADWDRNLEDPTCHLNEDHAYDRFLEELALIIQKRAPFCANHGI